MCVDGQVVCDCGNCNESSEPETSATAGTTEIPPEPTTVEPDTTTGAGVDCSMDPPTFPQFDRACVEASDCALVFHQVDCCGTRVAWGLSGAASEPFAEAEATCVDQFPRCDCATKPTVADDGEPSVDDATIGVTCKDGSCFSFVP